MKCELGSVRNWPCIYTRILSLYTHVRERSRSVSIYGVGAPVIQSIYLILPHHAHDSFRQAHQPVCRDPPTHRVVPLRTGYGLSRILSSASLTYGVPCAARTRSPLPDSLHKTSFPCCGAARSPSPLRASCVANLPANSPALVVAHRKARTFLPSGPAFPASPHQMPGVRLICERNPGARPAAQGGGETRRDASSKWMGATLRS